VIGLLPIADKVTAISTFLVPSAPLDAERSNETFGSLSAMVIVAAAGDPSAAPPVGFESISRIVSLGSSSVSSTMNTRNRFSVSPFSNVRRPLAVV
jgi:hypothetical protein